MKTQNNCDIGYARAFLDTAVPLFESVERARVERERHFGSTFRIAEYAVGHSEVSLNRIFADLLNPIGLHGQGPAFLKLFLELFTPNLLTGDLDRWLVKLNHLTRERRMVDLALFWPDRVAIYIECKPWASEGHEQLKDYAEDLLRRSESEKRLLFVPPTRDCESISLTSDLVVRLGSTHYQICPFLQDDGGASIVEWLDRCAKASQATNVRLFIEDLAAYLNVETSKNGSEKTMRNDPFVTAILEYALADRARLKVTLRLDDAARELRMHIVRSFIESLERALRDRMSPDLWEVTVCLELPGYVSVDLRKHTWCKGWGFKLEKLGSNFGPWKIGFACPSRPEHLEESGVTVLATDDDRTEIYGKLADTLASIGDATRTDAWWPAYCWLRSPYCNWDDETLLILAGLEGSGDPDQRTAPELFVSWFCNLADAVGGGIDDILARRAAVVSEVGNTARP